MSVEAVRWDERVGAWLVGGPAEAAAVLRGEGWSSDPGRLPGAELAGLPPAILLFMDPPDHTRLRSLLAPLFTPRAVEPLRPRVAAVVDAVLKDLPDRFDLVPQVAYLVPIAVIAELLDVGPEGAELLLDVTPRLTAMLEPLADGAAIVAAVAASAEVTMFLTPLIAERLRRPGRDLISSLLHVPDGPALDEVAATCVLLLAAGHETTANLIGTSVLTLLETPETGIDVEHLLRTQGPIKRTVRIATADHDLGGHRIAAGQVVHLLLHEANRGDGPNLAFGAGAHHCLGAALARMEVTETLTRLFDRHPGLALDGTPVWRQSDTFHGLTALPVARTARVSGT